MSATPDGSPAADRLVTVSVSTSSEDSIRGRSSVLMPTARAVREGYLADLHGPAGEPATERPLRGSDAQKPRRRSDRVRDRVARERHDRHPRGVDPEGRSVGGASVRACVSFAADIVGRYRDEALPVYDVMSRLAWHRDRPRTDPEGLWSIDNAEPELPTGRFASSVSGRRSDTASW